MSRICLEIVAVVCDIKATITIATNIKGTIKYSCDFNVATNSYLLINVTVTTTSNITSYSNNYL